MKKKSSIIISTVTALTILFAPGNGFAETNPSEKIVTNETTKKLSKPFINGNEGTYTYWIQEGSSKKAGTTAGKWVSAKETVTGPATMNRTFTTSTSYTVTVDGGLTKNDIKRGLSASLTKQESISTSAIRKIPKGKVGVFQSQDQYTLYNVVMRKWLSVDGKKMKLKDTKKVQIKRKTGVTGRIILK